MVESAAAALAVTQSDSPDPAQVGEDVTYTVQVHNGGPDDAEAVTLTDTLPGRQHLRDGDAVDGHLLRDGRHGDLRPRFARRRRRCFRGHHRHAGRSRHDQQRRVGLLDHRRSRPLRQRRTGADDRGRGGGRALALTQADSPDPVQVGENVTYTVQVHNGGPDDAEAVTLTDTLPGASTFQSATPSTGTCSKTAGTVTCNLGLLAADDDASVAIIVRADPAGTISNTASVSSTTDDPDDSDNTAGSRRP